MIAKTKESKLSGKMTVPGSKSHTIRAVMLGLLADGTTVIHDPAASGDGLAARRAAAALGAEIEVDGSTWRVRGVAGRPSVPDDVIDTGNSGTTTSFCIGVCTLIDQGCAVITGDEQIRRRPWLPETEALRSLGADIRHTRPDSSSPPVVVSGPLRGGRCALPGFNSQFVSGVLVPSALLPAGAHVEIEVDSPMETPYIDMTIEWMKRFGADVWRSDDFTRLRVEGGSAYRAIECRVPADWSSAAFPLVAAAITGSEITVDGLDFSDSQGDKAIVDILTEMGAVIDRDDAAMRATVRAGTKLRAIDIDLSATPDALPALAVTAAFAEGRTRFTSLAHVRVKETDRVAVMCDLLSRCGIDTTSGPDEMTVVGGRPSGARIPSHGDHRVAMAMTVCGLASSGEMEVIGAECASVSYPGFFDALRSVGANVVEREQR